MYILATTSTFKPPRMWHMPWDIFYSMTSQVTSQWHQRGRSIRMKDVSACLRRCCSPSPWQPWPLLAGTPTIAIWFDIFQTKCVRPNVGWTNRGEEVEEENKGIQQGMGEMINIKDDKVRGGRHRKGNKERGRLGWNIIKWRGKGLQWRETGGPDIGFTELLMVFLKFQFVFFCFKIVKDAGDKGHECVIANGW